MKTTKTTRTLYEVPDDGSQVLFVTEDGKAKAIVFCRCKHERQFKSTPTKDGATAKTPRGWRKIGDEFLCGECVSQRFYARSFRVQITGLAQKVDKHGRTITQFRRELVEAANESARYGNWLVQQLYVADSAASTPQSEWPKTRDGKPRLPPLGEVEAYRPDLFPRLSPATLSALSQMVRGWYTERRFECFAVKNRSLENYRFGYLPVEVRAQDWQIVATDEGRYIFRRITVQPGPSWEVAVHCDVRNLAALRQCVSGEAVPLGLKIVRRSKQPIPGTSGKPVKAWFFRVSVLLPRKPRRQSHQEITLQLGHDRDVLLYGALDDDSEPFEFPGVAVRELIVNGDKADRRRQQEQLMTRGLVSKRGHKRWYALRTRICANRGEKIDYQLRLAAKALARWCKSHNVTSVDYDAADRGFLPHFPYHQLASCIANKLEEEGIGFHVTSQESPAPASNGKPAQVVLAEPKGETGA